MPLIPHLGFLLFIVVDSSSIFHKQHSFFILRIEYCVVQLNPQLIAVIQAIENLPLPFQGADQDQIVGQTGYPRGAERSYSFGKIPGSLKSRACFHVTSIYQHCAPGQQQWLGGLAVWFVPKHTGIRPQGLLRGTRVPLRGSRGNQRHRT